MGIKRGTVSLLLVYEPGGISQRPIPIARTGDTGLTEAAARSIIQEADERADELENVDADLCAIERNEADRIRALLLKLIPTLTLNVTEQSPTVQ
jgi:hypothetical protein